MPRAPSAAGLPSQDPLLTLTPLFFLLCLAPSYQGLGTALAEEIFVTEAGGVEQDCRGTGTASSFCPRAGHLSQAQGAVGGGALGQRADYLASLWAAREGALGDTEMQDRLHILEDLNMLYIRQMALSLEVMP